MKGSPPDAVNALVVAAALRIALEGDPGRDLRAVHNSFETEIVFLEVTAESPVTDLSEDGSGEVDTKSGLDFPHQVGANSEPPNLATYGGVIRLVKIVTGAQSDIRIEPVIVLRDGAVQLPVEDRGELVRDLHLGRVDYSIDCRAPSGSS